jgi:Haloacid dehalogenase-like hydrolase
LRQPHPEVPGALRRLRDHGFRLFTLTDNTFEISGRQLERGGVIDLFERRFSVDETVKMRKPSQSTYHWFAGELGADPANLCLVACHVCDTIGALAAGWQAGLILRTGNAPLGVDPPTLVTISTPSPTSSSPTRKWDSHRTLATPSIDADLRPLLHAWPQPQPLPGYLVEVGRSTGLVPRPAS